VRVDTEEDLSYTFIIDWTSLKIMEERQVMAADVQISLSQRDIIDAVKK
jgi:hypothetical protein